MGGTVVPWPYPQWTDDNGDPLNGGSLSSFAAGTSTPVTTYSDASLGGGFANANPTVLDSAGRAKIFLTPGVSYKFVLKNSAGVTIWTIDNVSATPGAAANTDITGTAGENLSAGDVVVISDGTGGRTAGRWYRGDSDDVNTSTLPALMGFAPAAITSGAPGSIRLGGEITGLSGLTPGILQYIASTAGGLTATAPANARPVAVANSSTSILIFQATQLAGPLVAAGLMGITAQSFAGIKTFAVNPLYFPGTQTTNSAQINGTIYSDITSHTSTGTVAETLATFQFPANYFDANGKGFKLYAWGKYAANANNKRTFVDFATNQIIEVSAATNDRTWDIEVTLLRRTSGDARVLGKITVGGSAVDNNAPGVVGSYRESVIEALGGDFTATPSIRVRTVDSTAAGGTTCLGFIVTAL